MLTFTSQSTELRERGVTMAPAAAFGYNLILASNSAQEASG